ncbi:MAG: T9SS type A sorting domain-containing protein [Bacteroidia bacterium]
MKNIFIAIIYLTLSLTSFHCKAQTIPDTFWGGNAWMPDTVGVYPTTAKWHYYNGKMHNNWSNVALSNITLIRFGGSAADSMLPSNYQYLKMIDSARAKGMEPILQVPARPSMGYDSSLAHSIVQYVNITHGRNVKYWIIGNEPNQYPASPVNFKNAAYIAGYIRKYAEAMKRVDPTIKIIGPGMSRIKPEDHNDPDQIIVDSLTKTNWTGSIVQLIPSTGHGVASGKAYIDYFSWHMYNFDGTGSNTQTRSWVLSRLITTDSARMGKMKRKLDSCNTVLSRSSQPLRPFITEANICTQGGGSQPTDDTLGGVKCSGFLAGQHWCEMMSLGIAKGIECVNFWSSIEGSEMGFMTNATADKKSTYFHMQQMAKWFRGTHYIGAHSTGNIKAFGCKNGNYMAVMVLNQDARGTAKKTYSVRLDNPSGLHGNWVTMNMSTNSTAYTDSIEASSTTLLIYNCNGSIAYKYRYEIDDMENPFKSVWAAVSPATLLTVYAGDDETNGSCCNTTLIATPNITSGTTFKWYEGSNSSYFSTNDTVVVNPANTTVFKVEVTNNSCTAEDYVTVNIGGETSCPGNCDEEEGGAGGKFVNTLQQEIKGSSKLLDNVPNPAQHKTTIYYTLGKETGKAEIRITDLSGALKQRIPVSTETSSVEIDCGSLEQGIYFYSLIVNDKRAGVKKMAVIK